MRLCRHTAKMSKSSATNFEVHEGGLLKIQANTVVSFHYRMTDEAGKELEESHSGDQILYLHGKRSMLPGLEEALEGRGAGEAFSVVVPPAKGYGERTEESVQRVPKKRVLTKGRLSPGMVVKLDTDNGVREAVLLKVGLKSVDIDSNHLLAGKTLNFDVEIVEVREATAIEKSHGHAHGAGGHQH